MATLATFWKTKRCDGGGRASSRAIRGRVGSLAAARLCPNDDIYFYSKKIDNSRVVRQADPAARGECWSAVGAARACC